MQIGITYFFHQIFSRDIYQIFWPALNTINETITGYDRCDIYSKQQSLPRFHFFRFAHHLCGFCFFYPDSEIICLISFLYFVYMKAFGIIYLSGIQYVLHLANVIFMSFYSVLCHNLIVMSGPSFCGFSYQMIGGIKVFAKTQIQLATIAGNELSYNYIELVTAQIIIKS